MKNIEWIVTDFSLITLINNLSNQDIINGLTGSVTQRDATLKQVYQNRYLWGFVRGLTYDDDATRDLFHDALIIFDRQVREEVFRDDSDWKTYFVGIVKYILLNKRRKKDNQTIELKPEIHARISEHLEQTILADERRELLERVISGLEPECINSLEMYKLSFSMKEIAESTNISESNAKKRAERCRQKLRELIKKDPELHKVLHP